MDDGGIVIGVQELVVLLKRLFESIAKLDHSPPDQKFVKIEEVGDGEKSHRVDLGRFFKTVEDQGIALKSEPLHLAEMKFLQPMERMLRILLSLGQERRIKIA